MSCVGTGSAISDHRGGSRGRGAGTVIVLDAKNVCHRHLVSRFEPATAERTADISSAYNYDVHVVPSFIDPGSDLRSAVSAMLDAFIWTLSGTCTDRRHHGRQRAVRDMQEE